MKDMLENDPQRPERPKSQGKGATSFGINPQTKKLMMGRMELPMPQSRPARLTVGGLLVLGGCLGFLPVVGFWMVPLGLLVLSHDLATVRRWRRKVTVWWVKRKSMSGKG